MLKPLDNWRSDQTLETFHTGLYMGLIRGRTMQKCADDLDRYEEIIEATRPDVVIETGTRWGGSAEWFADRVEQVISIDLEPQLTQTMIDNTRVSIKYVQSNSVAPLMIPALQHEVAGKRVMVSLDSDHHANHVWQEIASYGPLVSRGCFLVVEDACFDMWTGDDARRGGRRIPEEGGPLKAMQLAGLEVDPRYKRDEDIEGWTQVSHSPCGWWERV